MADIHHGPNNSKLHLNKGFVLILPHILNIFDPLTKA